MVFQAGAHGNQPGGYKIEPIPSHGQVRGPGLVVLAAGTVCHVEIQISLSRETVRPSHIPVWL